MSKPANHDQEDISYYRKNYKYVDGRVHQITADGTIPVVCYKGMGGYCGLYCRGKFITLHRFIWLLCHGTVPKVIDHINGDTADNRIENLREVTHRENCQNKKCHREGNAPGVYATKTGYKTMIRINKTRIYLGEFGTEKEASTVYQTACDNIASFKNDIGAFLRLIQKESGITTRSLPKGYYWDKQLQLYITTICIHYKRVHLGIYAVEAHAAEASKQAKVLKKRYKKDPEGFLTEWKRLKSEVKATQSPIIPKIYQDSK